jgi:hypothetical protein
MAVRTLARRQRVSLQAAHFLLHCFQANPASLRCREPRPLPRIGLVLP